jgi:hypothetical protein
LIFVPAHFPYAAEPPDFAISTTTMPSRISKIRMLMFMLFRKISKKLVNASHGWKPVYKRTPTADPMNREL